MSLRCLPETCNQSSRVLIYSLGHTISLPFALFGSLSAATAVAMIYKDTP
jgi:hypothetical protein